MRQTSLATGDAGVVGLGSRRDASEEDVMLESICFAAHSPSLLALLLASISSSESPRGRFCFEDILTVS